MQVGVQRQVLPPGVQHGQEADPRPEVLWVGGHLQQRPGDGLEQQAVHHPLVAQSQGIEGVGQGEDDVEVRHRQQVGGLFVQPGGAGRCLAFGTVPIAAGVVCRALVAALIAGLHMPAQRCRAAGGDVAQDAPLLARQLGHEGTEPADHVSQVRRGRRDLGHRRGGWANS